MSKVQDISEVRKKYKKKSIVKRIILLLLIFLLVLVALSFTNETVRNRVNDWISTVAAEFGGGSGFPVSLAGANPVELASMSNDLGVLTDTNFYVYNQNGKEIGNIKHGFTNPKVVVNSSMSAIYDRGGKKLVLSSKTKEILTQTYEFSILTADLAKNGYLAVATGSQRYTSQLTVYDNSQKEFMHWYSAQNHIVSLSILSDGSGIAVGTLGAENGSLKSTLHLLSFSSEEPIATLDFPGEAIYAVDCKEGGNIFVLTDKAARVVSAKGKVEGEYIYGATNLVSFSTEGSKQVVLVFGDYNQYQQATVVMLNQKGEKTGEVSLQESVKGLSVSGDKVALLLQRQAVVYSMSGEQIRTVPVERGSIGVQMAGSGVYVSMTGEIRKG
ncbi:DUF5711 family protein [Zongyangia hominis]|uniref:Uncharacterized protein n=1 Tax=Zongyangia hominis TaxID=2763677 RepID=A0A926E8F6_9FIRM|nr:DUF5711 family protein [Zongyangia hominis]MBC8569227.1 hypothetical protein [Zongyangia hominis]